jgi:hypothetical protein
MTQLGGKDPLAAIAAGGLFNRRQAQAEESAVAVAQRARDEAGQVPAVARDRPPMRVEVRAEAPLEVTARASGLPPTSGSPPPDPDSRPGPTPRPRVPSGQGWREPAEPEPGYSLYRPSRSSVTTVDVERTQRAEARSET